MGVNSVSRQDLRALYATDVARTPAPQLHGTEAVGKGQEEMPAKAPERALRQSQPKEEQAQRAAKMLSAGPQPARPIAANRWRRGLFSAYWSQRAYLGEFTLVRPEDIAAELAPFGPATILIYDDVELARAMGRSEHFELIEVSVDRDGGDVVGWLEYEPHGDRTGDNGH